MFEDSLVESTGRIRTRSGRLAAASFLFEAAMMAVLVLLPYLYPAALPRQALSRLLTAPPPPPAHANLPEHAAASRPAPAMLALLTLPGRIPTHAAIAATGEPQTIGLYPSTPSGSDPLSNLLGLGSGSAPRVAPPPAPKPKPGPVRVSAGVAAGALLAPIQTAYPAIAKAAHIQGTVVIEATISKTGAVENAHVVSGPPMLAQAALSAVAQARYRPYQLNGEPVEVETTVSVVFRLDQ